jgi:uncharacterized phage-associated protein
MKSFTKDQIEKIGNAIVLFAERIPDLSKTKLLKLLYFLEEQYIKKYNIPLLGIDFEVWQAGPVAREIFIDLSQDPVLFKDFIETENRRDAVYIKPKKPFCDDEFSDNELEMMNFILDHLGSLPAHKLVRLTHRKSSLWYKQAGLTGLLELFEKGLTNSSEEKIDFRELLDEKSQQIYDEQLSLTRFAGFING